MARTLIGFGCAFARRNLLREFLVARIPKDRHLYFPLETTVDVITVIEIHALYSLLPTN
jgi:hypothetical protein